MLDSDLRKLLIAQIGNEFAAHALYMGISVFFDRQSLRRLGQVLPPPSDRRGPARPEDHGLPDRQRGRVRPAGPQGRDRPASGRRMTRRPAGTRVRAEVAAQFDPMAARRRRRPATTAATSSSSGSSRNRSRKRRSSSRSSTSSTAASTCSRRRPCSTASSRPRRPRVDSDRARSAHSVDACATTFYFRCPA